MKRPDPNERSGSPRTPAECRSDVLRAKMVRDQLAARGIRDENVLSAMGAVPREAFVREDLAEFAYDDRPLPIAENQTISQPFVVAFMIEAAGVAQGSRVLEVGAGSGYAAAVVSRIAREVYAVERHRELAEGARERLSALGYDNVHVIHADGSRGLPEYGPYDAILVSAGGPAVPPELQEQLALGGRLVIPVGDEPRSQDLIRVVRRSEKQYSEENLGAVQFVPLVGEAGWSDALGGTTCASSKRRGTKS